MYMDKKAVSTRIRLLYCGAGLAALAGGIAVYALFRNHDMLLFRLIPRPAFLNMLSIPVTGGSTAGSALRYNLPDGLWFLSGAIYIRALWLANPRWRAFYFGVFAIAAFTLEIVQILPTVPGTFDPLDMLCMALFAFLENCMFNLFIKRRIA